MQLMTRMIIFTFDQIYTSSDDFLFVSSFIFLSLVMCRISLHYNKYMFATLKKKFS